MNEEHKLLPVTQEDRNAAADEELRRLVAAGPYPSCPPQVWMVQAVRPIRMGVHDDSPQVQAFARHRLTTRPIPSTEAEGLAGELERAVNEVRAARDSGETDTAELLRLARFVVTRRDRIITALRNSPSPDREGVERLRGFANGKGPTLAPYIDHNGFDQHDRLRADVRTALANTPQAGPTEAGEGSGLADELEREIASVRELAAVENDFDPVAYWEHRMRGLAKPNADDREAIAKLLGDWVPYRDVSLTTRYKVADAVLSALSRTPAGVVEDVERAPLNKADCLRCGTNPHAIELCDDCERKFRAALSGVQDTAKGDGE